MKDIIYVDEAGYTGEDMLDSDQPVMVVASHKIKEEECEEIVWKIFGVQNGNELKHTKLRKYNKGQNNVVKLIEELGKRNVEAGLWFAHKKFVLFQRLVDYFVEPYFFRRGFNFYAKGANIATCNMAYYCLIGFEGEGFVDELLRRFYLMMVDRTEENYERFWMFLRSRKHESHKNSIEILNMLELGDERGIEELMEIPENALDISFTMALTTIAAWRDRSPGPFQIIHDNSSNMMSMKNAWDQLTSPDVEEMIVGHGDFRKIKFPLNVSETKFCNSKDFRALQIADVLAGAMFECCRVRAGYYGKTDYVDKLFAVGIERFVINGIWPSDEVEQTEQISDSSAMKDPLETLGKLMVRKK